MLLLSVTFARPKKESRNCRGERRKKSGIAFSLDELFLLSLESGKPRNGYLKLDVIMGREIR